MNFSYFVELQQLCQEWTPQKTSLMKAKVSKVLNMTVFTHQKSCDQRDEQNSS